MATKLSKIETLQEAKERVRKVFRPSDEDPVVRFIGENGKMGLRHLMSEEVVEAPTQDFIEMPEAEVIEPVISEKDQAWNQWRAAFDEAEKHVQMDCGVSSTQKVRFCFLLSTIVLQLRHGGIRKPIRGGICPIFST